MSITPTHLYNNLIHHFGEQHWWPVDNSYHDQHQTDPRSEIIIGAVLTQNTAWSNVENALINLKKTHNLSIKNIVDISDNELKSLIKPSGYFNQKTDRLKKLMTHIYLLYKGDLSQFFSFKIDKVRTELLSINGIGPETTDSILLYAGNYPIFVVDAYTKRISKRLPIELQNDSYSSVQAIFQNDLIDNFSKEKITFVYQQFHAMIVELAKNFCKTKPECTDCPMNKNCEYFKLNK
jgi:endonuclease-3 related protein